MALHCCRRCCMQACDAMRHCGSDLSGLTVLFCRITQCNYYPPPPKLCAWVKMYDRMVRYSGATKSMSRCPADALVRSPCTRCTRHRFMGRTPHWFLARDSGLQCDANHISGWIRSVTPPPCVTFRLVVAPLRGPGRSPVLPFACCVGSLLSVGRCGLCPPPPPPETTQITRNSRTFREPPPRWIVAGKPGANIQLLFTSPSFSSYGRRSGNFCARPQAKERSSVCGLRGLNQNCSSSIPSFRTAHG